MPLVPYNKLVNIKIADPCMICGKRPLVKDTAETQKDGKKIRVCAKHLPKEEVTP